VKARRKSLHIQNSDSPIFSGTQELFDSETALIGYTTSIVEKFHKYLNLQQRVIEHHGKLLEFGAGTGFLAEIFRQKFKISPVCVELSPDLISTIKSKKFECHQYLRETPQSFSAIYTSNVLEHIQDDSEILTQLYEKITPGGVIGIYVPAHQFLFSTMDEQIGHVRRYSKKDLMAKTKSAGFEIKRVQYDDFLGFFASLVVKLIGYKNKANLGSARSLLIYDRLIYPVSRALDTLGFKYLVGKNLFIVAEKQPFEIGAE
jgi:SAM-dependent methyltransferase